VRRRDFIAGLAGAATVGGAQAQQTGKVYRIAIVSPATPVTDMSEASGHQGYRAFFEELRRLGYVEGQNIVIERYSGGGRAEHYPELARDIVRRNPDLVFAGTFRIVLDLKAATATIPIVGLGADPVGWGVAPKLSQPIGNITGVSIDAGLEIWGKRLELLRQIVPTSSKIGFLVSRSYWNSPMGLAMRDAASRAGISLLVPPFDMPIQEAKYRLVLSSMVQDGVAALIVHDQPENLANRRLIINLAKQVRLPAIYPFREFVEVGGLVAYAIDWAEVYQQIVRQIDQIFKGVKPADIPFYQATRFALIINLKTAKALGIEMPSSLLAQADEVIE
jgi:putative tryptophan/tyrosine transport system substrate-binding protein